MAEQACNLVRLMKETEISKLVIREIAAALLLSEESITMSSTLGAELGAESIDYLDITFRLEKTFSVTIPEGELFQDTRKHPSTLTISDIVEYLLSRLA